MGRALDGCTSGATPTPTRTPTPGGSHSVCGGAVASVPQLCHFKLSPDPVRRNGTVTVQLGLVDKEGDISVICGGIGPASDGPPSITCNSTDQAGGLVNAVVQFPPITVGLAAGDYRFDLYVRDAAGHTSNTVTATFKVTDVRV